MTVLFPLIYIMGGLLAGRFLPGIRQVLAKLLTVAFIPYVIVYNLLTYQEGTALIAGFSFSFCALLFMIGQAIWSDRLAALTFSYLNIGWLGLPLAIAIFGDEASRIIIAAYIGSSVFGNLAGVAALQAQADWPTLVRKTLSSPPVLAVIIGLGLSALPFDLAGVSELQLVYDLSKHLMSIAGMGVLGIWLYSTRITTATLRAAIPVALMRGATGTILIGLFELVCHHLDVQMVTDNAWVLFLLPLLPPAANIVVLETHYRGSGHSAPAIASGTLVSLGMLAIYAAVVVMY